MYTFLETLGTVHSMMNRYQRQVEKLNLDAAVIAYHDCYHVLVVGKDGNVLNYLFDPMHTTPKGTVAIKGRSRERTCCVESYRPLFVYAASRDVAFAKAYCDVKRLAEGLDTKILELQKVARTSGGDFTSGIASSCAWNWNSWPEI